jgi:MFS family permease
MTTISVTAPLPRRYSRNIWLYTFISCTSNTAFVAGNWMFFWLRVMTMGQLGVIDALSFAFGMIMEIPTGAIGDMLGKRWTIILATLFNAVGWSIMAMSNSISEVIIGFWIAQIGGAFYSGAADALLYDSMLADGRKDDYDRVYSMANNATLVTLIVSVLVGGWMYVVDFRFPHVAWALAFILALFAAVFLIEPPVENRQHFTVRGYFRQLSEGFRQLQVPALRPHLLPIIAVRGAVFMFYMGLITPTMALAFGFDVNAQAVLWAVLLFGELVGNSLSPTMRRRVGAKPSLVIAGVLVAVGYVSGALPLGILGAATMFLVRLGGGIMGPISSTIINDAIPSEARATTLSTVAMLLRIPYVVCAIIAGSMAEAGTFGLFCLVVGAGLLAVSVVYGRSVLTPTHDSP